jgi:rare lipoprotein A
MLAPILVLSACAHRDGAPRQPAQDIDKISNPVLPKTLAKSPFGNPPSYRVNGKRYYVLPDAEGYNQTGLASWYGIKFHGRRTSSGEVYDMYGMTAAHKTLPLPAYVRVTHLGNKRSVIVKVNDRGPFYDGRIIDLSYVAAKKLGVYDTGTAKVRVEILVAPSDDVSDPNRSLALQVAAFKKAENAREFVEKLERKTHLTADILETSINGSVVYRVRIPLKSSNEADEVNRKLKTMNIKQTYLTTQ